MAYHTYTTEAFILGGAAVGEGSRTLALYTKDLGLIYGLAKSVRELRSKLRYGLQPASLADVSLIKGREVWRIVGAREKVNFTHTFRHAPHHEQLMARALSLLRRLVQGEEPHRELFLMLVEAFEFLHHESLSRKELPLFEGIIVLRMLHMLGYVAKQREHLIPVLDLTLPFSRELLTEVAPYEKELITEINRSIMASQL